MVVRAVDRPGMRSPQSTATERFRTSPRNTVAFTLVILAAFLLRFIGLGRECLWLDEVTSITIARLDVPSVVAWAAGDIHPPLYYLVLHFWLRLGETELAVRALSAVLGILTVVVVYALAQQMFGRRVGLLSALLLACAPLHIWYSQETRMYAMVTLWSALASYLLWLALHRRQRRFWLGYVLASTLALYTHYFALFVLFSHALFTLYWLWQQRHAESDGSVVGKSTWRPWLAAEAAIALSFVPWLPILYHQATTGGGGWVERSVGRPTLRALLDTWMHFSLGLEAQYYPVLLRRAAYAAFAVCLVLALTRLFRDRRREGGVFCVITLVVPLATVWLISQVKPMYTVRYLLPFLPPYCILVASGIDLLKSHWARVALILLLGSALLLGDWNAWRVERNPDWRGATAYVLSLARPGDVALFSPRWNAKPFDYYCRGRVPIDTDLPIPVTTDAVQSVMADVRGRYQRVWLFWEVGHYSDPTGLAKQTLDAGFPVVDAHDFRGIGSVVLYDLTLPRSGS